MTPRLGLAIALLWAGLTAGAAGQALGTFRWQLHPFCNLITLSVRQDGGVYTLDGSDDQCGAAERTSVIGTAFLNPDGSIGMGLTSMAGPGAAPVILQARLDLSTVGGTWSDSAGNTGAFVFTPGAGAGGAPRPVPANGIRPGSVTSEQLSPGAVGAAQIALGSIGAPQIADRAITAEKIAAGAVTATHIAAGAVGPAQLAPGTVGLALGVIGTSQIAAGAITSPLIAAGAVGSAHIAAGVIGSAHIANAAVGPAQLAPGAVQLPLSGTCPVGRYLRGVTAQGGIVCEPFFVPAVVSVADDPAAIVGTETSIAIGSDGLPIISHYDGTESALRITKCGNAACSAGNVSTTIDNQSFTTGRFAAIAIGADGLPVISHEGNSDSLRVTKCVTMACAGSPVTTIVDGPPVNLVNVGSLSSIAIGVDGFPVISHSDDSADALRVTKCGNGFCTAGNVSTTIDDQANVVGRWSSIAIGLDGLPVISHQDVTAAAVRVTKCGNAACTSGNVSTTVDDHATSSYGLHTSIVVPADGLPVMSYQDSTAGALRITKCGNPACSGGNVSTTVDDPPSSVGSFGGLAIGADGLPIASHRDSTLNALRITKCGNAACTAGNVSVTVDDNDNSLGWTTSIALGADGLPVIAHSDGTANTLRVVKCGTQSCR